MAVIKYPVPIILQIFGGLIGIAIGALVGVWWIQRGANLTQEYVTDSDTIRHPWSETDTSKIDELLGSVFSVWLANMSLILNGYLLLGSSSVMKNSNCFFSNSATANVATLLSYFTDIVFGTVSSTIALTPKPILNGSYEI